MNLQIAGRVIEELVRAGVCEFCVCPGARNAPFVKVLGASNKLKKHSFFDERSAAFFALGRAKKTGSPVAVVTTSGTAVAELLPATVEAHYSRLPLVLLTADRPANYRHSGAPQSIQQVGIFSHFVESVFDLTQPCDFQLPAKIRRPVHVNVCFDEPILSGEMPKLNLSPTSLVDEKKTEPLSEELSALTSFFERAKRPVVIVGEMRKSESMVEALVNLGAPIYGESHSNLAAHPKLEKLMIKSGEAYFRNSAILEKHDSVIRVGGTPTLRYWRDLDGKYSHTPVLSVNHLPYSGLAREKSKPIGYLAFEKFCREYSF